MPTRHQITERQRHAHDRALTKIEMTRRRIRCRDHFAIDSRHYTSSHDFTDAHGRATGHRTWDLKRNAQGKWLFDTLGDMHRQRVPRYNVPAHTRRSDAGSRAGQVDDTRAVRQQRQQCLREEERAFEMNIEQAVELRFTDGAQGVEQTLSGIIHQAAECCEAPDLAQGKCH